MKLQGSIISIGLLLSGVAFTQTDMSVDGQLRLRNEHRHFPHNNKDKRNVTGY